jgi:predicted enzyme related to lactoylglutathione lyase
VLARTRGRRPLWQEEGRRLIGLLAEQQETLTSVRWSFRRQEPAQHTGDHANVSTVNQEAAVPEFPPIAHVAVTVTDLERSTRWYSELLAAEPVLDEDEQAGGFHHTVFALDGGQLFGLHAHPQGQVTDSTSIAPAWIMWPSLAVTAVSCRGGPRAWTSWALRTAESRTPTTALVSPSATPMELRWSSSRRRLTQAAKPGTRALRRASALAARACAR